MVDRWKRTVGARSGGETYQRSRDAELDAARTWLDPYYRWAQATNWRGFARVGRWQGDDPLDLRGRERGVRIIARASSADEMDKARALARAADPWLQMSHIYLEPDLPCEYFTAALDRNHLPLLADWLPGLQWELAAPVRDPLAAPLASALGYFGPTRDELSFRRHDPFRRRTPKPVARGSIRGDVVAVIDFGCPFLNRRFAGAEGTGTRLAALWDQSVGAGEGADAPAPRKPEAIASADRRHWAKPEAFDHGRELSAAAMSAMCRSIRAGEVQCDEADGYAGINYMLNYEDPRRRVHFATHGGHVLDMAGGGRDPLTDAADAAGKAKLVFVQLPGLTVADSSGGSLAAHLLDAIRYILYVCDPAARIAVNISYGTFAGPHDGSSMIECAIDEVLEKRPNDLAIVLAAGNARQSACHVRREVGPQRSALMRWRLVPMDTTDTFVEVWYEPPPSPAQLQVRVRRAAEAWGPWLLPGDSARLDELASGEPVGMVFHDGPVFGRAKALILAAFRPTQSASGDDGPLAEAGEWEMELALVGNAAAGPVVTVDGWVERDDPNDYSGRMQSCFVGLQRGDDQQCLSSIATGRHTVVVGGFRIGSGQPAPYSSIGTRDSALPLYYAACERDALEPGIDAAATSSTEILKMNGTSVAAPVMARRLLNAMARPRQAPIARGDWREVIESLIDAEPADGDAPYIRRPPPDAAA